MSNEVFDFKRFGLYAARSWSLYMKKYLIHAGVFGAVMITILLLPAIFDKGVGSGDLRDDIFPWFVILTVVFFATFPVDVMKPLKSRLTLTTENMVPATTTEKWLFVLLNTTVVAVVLYLLMLSMAVLTGMATSGIEPFIEYARNPNDWWPFLPLGCLVLQAGMMYAGTMENRNHRASFLLIAVTVLAAFFIFVGFPAWLSHEVGTEIKYGPLFTFDYDRVDSGLSTVQYFGGMFGQNFNSIAVNRLVTCVGIAIALVFWTCAWFNFRERSIK